MPEVMEVPGAHRPSLTAHRKDRVCGGGIALCVQAVTLRLKTAEARNIRMRRAHELFMIDPSGVSGKSQIDPSDITFSPCNTG